MDRTNGSWPSLVTFPLGKPPDVGIVWPGILEHSILMVFLTSELFKVVSGATHPLLQGSYPVPLFFLAQLMKICWHRVDVQSRECCSDSRQRVLRAQASLLFPNILELQSSSLLVLRVIVA